MKRKITALALAAAVLVAAPRQADGQSDQILATATIAGALTVTAGNDLDFQTVIPNFTKTVAVNDATAGTFALSGGAGAEVTLTFTLPADLVETVFGIELLPITFTGVPGSSRPSSWRTWYTTLTCMPVTAVDPKSTGTRSGSR